jgi:peptidoglycan/LPS O-acetylase OafA/YrhL
VTTERRHDIDWLRVFALLAAFVFHCTRFFDTEGWHLNNAVGPLRWIAGNLANLPVI